MNTRVNRLFEKAEAHDLDSIVLANATEPMLDMTFFYVTRLGAGGLFEGSFAICNPPDKVEVITSILEEESAKHGDFPVHAFKVREERKEMLADSLKDAKRIGVNARELTYAHLLYLKEIRPDAEFIDISKAVAAARLVKDGEEIEATRVACRIASEAIVEVRDFIKPGVKETEVAAELCYIMQKKGAAGPSFDTIVAFQENAAEPHYRAGERKLADGEFVLIDFGALYNRYVSDITRTMFMGKASEKQKKIYQTVLDAQQKALDVIKAGIKGADAHNAAAGHIDSTEFKGMMTHGLGHSIGLNVHDGSGLSPAVDVTLEEGMIFTVEPGIYIPGYGGVRIEDDIAVTKDGYDMLTTAPKDLVEL